MNLHGTPSDVPYTDELAWPDGLEPLRNLDEGGLAEPFAQYGWLRQNAPVVRLRTPGEDVWVVTRYSDLRKATRTPKVFGSRMAEGNQPTFITLFDGNDHTRLRRVYADAFNPKSVALVEDRVHERAEHLVGELLGSRGGDVVERLAIPLTMATIGGILGVPLQDMQRLKFWSDQLLVWHARFRGLPSTEESAAHTQDFFAYLQERLEELWQGGSESVGGHLARNWKSGAISAKEAREMGAFLFMAGHDTTTFLIGHAFRELAADNGLLARFRDDPNDVDRFIEELARYRGPVQRVHRRTTDETEVGGSPIPRGALVRLVIASANRDGDAIESAETFDIDRDNSAHVGFGHGVHSCIGAPLARLELRVLLRVLAEQVESLTIRTGSMELTPGHAITTGPTKLELDFTPRR